MLILSTTMKANTLKERNIEGPDGKDIQMTVLQDKSKAPPTGHSGYSFPNSDSAFDRLTAV